MRFFEGAIFDQFWSSTAPGFWRPPVHFGDLELTGTQKTASLKTMLLSVAASSQTTSTITRFFRSSSSRVQRQSMLAMSAVGNPEAWRHHDSMYIHAGLFEIYHVNLQFYLVLVNKLSRV